VKILQVFDLFTPHTNGTVKLLYELSKALLLKKHEVTIYCSDFKIDQGYIDSLQGLKAYPFHNWFNLAGFRIMPDIIGGARRGLHGFDIIHLHSCRSFANVVTHHYAKKYRVPYVLDAHGSAPRMTAGKRGVKWLLKWLFDIAFGYRLLRDASRVIAETEVGINEYRELGVKEDKIVLITPPLPVEEFADLPAQGLFRQKYDIKAKHVVMFLGRINWIKGLDFLAESFYELARHRSDVILAIVGPDDGYKPTLEGIVEKLKLSDRVLFTGFLGGKDKLSALVDADVVVQTSRYEQGAWAPLEAVLCSTPIIVSSNSGAGEDVRRIDAGYLVEWGNKNDLVDKIQYVLDNPDQTAIKTRKARDYLERNQSMSSRIREYEELYARCIREKGVR
jgi:glycosyltransferase involved in cell wall biosynthesis